MLHEERRPVASALIKKELGLTKGDLRESRNAGDPLADAIYRLALDCENQEAALEFALQAQESTLGAVRRRRDEHGMVDAMQLTGMPGAGLVIELAMLEGMIRSLKIMIEVYKKQEAAK